MAGKRLDLASVLPVGAASRERMTRNIALAAQSYWKSLAGSIDVSSQTRTEYRQGLVVAPTGNEGHTIRLTGLKANLIERGMGPAGIGSQGLYDVRKFLIKSGMFATVPFKYSSLASIKKSFGEAAKSAVSGLAEYNSTNRDAAKQSASAPRVRLGSGNAPIQRPKDAWVSKAPWHKSGPQGAVFKRHSSDFLAGAIKQTATSTEDGSTQTTITVFRRASWRGKAWMSRGVRARRLNDKVRRKIPDFMAMMVRQWRA